MQMGAGAWIAFSSTLCEHVTHLFVSLLKRKRLDAGSAVYALNRAV